MVKSMLVRAQYCGQKKKKKRRRKEVNTEKKRKEKKEGRRKGREGGEIFGETKGRKSRIERNAFRVTGIFKFHYST